MKLTLNTFVLNVSAAAKTTNHYQAGEFYQAIGELQELLDVDPGNWEARLMLAACLYKTDQYLAAQRAFQFLSQRTTDEEIRARAVEGLELTNSRLKIHKRSYLPAEFGFNDTIPPRPSVPAWLV